MSLLPFIQSRAGTEPVRLGPVRLRLVLGSGLRHLTNAVDGTAITYTDLPGFPHAGVSGHNPVLKVGTLECQSTDLPTSPAQSHSRQAATRT